MQPDIHLREFQCPDNRRNMVLIVAFGAFSYLLLSLWGALVADSLAVVVSPRRMVACSIGAGIFWLTLRRLRRESEVGLGSLLVSILIAGLAILAVRLGIDQLSVSPIEPEHSIRWSLAWSGYFGIWLLAAVPPGAARPVTHEQSTTIVGPGYSQSLPDVYLEQLLSLPDDAKA